MYVVYDIFQSDHAPRFEFSHQTYILKEDFKYKKSYKMYKIWFEVLICQMSVITLSADYDIMKATENLKLDCHAESRMSGHPYRT